MAALTLISLCACDDGGSARTNKASEDQERIVIASKGPRPEYTIPIELRTAEPEAAAFVDRFLSVCLGGDYTGYRRLVSRTRRAESKERFEAMYLGVKSLTVEIIEPISPGQRSRLPAETFRVVPMHISLIIRNLAALGALIAVTVSAAAQPTDFSNSATYNAGVGNFPGGDNRPVNPSNRDA
ncbi:MAG: hypothetical protein IH827_10825, partial [Myxococcales bacterium]|nr:hypothetical protein [Myxococcales bacterium]